LTEREYQRAIARVAETVSSMRETDAPNKCVVSSVLSGGECEAGELHNSTVPEVRGGDSGSQGAYGEGAGTVLFPKLRAVGKSDEEEVEADCGVSGVRSGIREVPLRNQEGQT
jgi:hypothetical protein